MLFLPIMEFPELLDSGQASVIALPYAVNLTDRSRGGGGIN